MHSAVDLAALITDPARAVEVPLRAIPVLLAQIAAEQGRLSALQAALAARLLVGERERSAPLDGDLLKAKPAAAMLQMSVHWLYKNAKKLPFTRPLGPRSLRFSADGIRRYLGNRRPA